MSGANADRAGQVLEELRQALAGARFAYVFGSILTAAFGDESDVDVAVDFGKPLAPAERLELAATLAAAAGRDVDLVDLRTADPVIKMQVLRNGRPLLVNDRLASSAFAMSALSEYFDLKLDRAPVEAMIARSRALPG
jgi:predicted nucleotidyltransferase